MRWAQPMADDTLRTKRLQALGQAIRSRRETLGISQRGLAEQVGTSQNAIYEWEAGLVAPGADKLWLLGDAFDMQPSELLAIAQEVAGPDE